MFEVGWTDGSIRNLSKNILKKGVGKQRVVRRKRGYRWYQNKIPLDKIPLGQNPPGQNPPGQNPPSIFYILLTVIYFINSSK